MSETSKQIKIALVATLCEHPDQEKYRAAAFRVDGVLGGFSAVDGLTRNDFFTKSEDGRYLIDTPGFWKNFDQINALLKKSGEAFTIDDFLHPLQETPSRTLLDNAVSNGFLGKLFCEEVWRGRFDEMECLWYYVRHPARKDFAATDGRLPLPLKRRLLQAENRRVPEDELAKAGLSPDDIDTALSSEADFNRVTGALAAAGDYLRKEYLMIRNGTGDTCFSLAGAWTFYPRIAETLKKHGDPMTVADFTHQVGNRAAILSRAADKEALSRVFAPGLWVGRIEEMDTLWSSYVLPGWKVEPMMSPRQFDESFMTAEDATYAPLMDFDRLHGKEDLLRPLDGEDAARPVIALGLASFWRRAEILLPHLQEKGERLTLADLRRPSGLSGHSCLMIAAKLGAFPVVLKALSEAGEFVSMEDLLQKDRHGVALYSVLAEQNQLPLLFDPARWVGRGVEARKLWNRMSHTERSQIDFSAFSIALQKETLRLSARRVPRLGKGGKK